MFYRHPFIRISYMVVYTTHVNVCSGLYCNLWMPRDALFVYLFYGMSILPNMAVQICLAMPTASLTISSQLHIISIMCALFQGHCYAIC